MNGIDPNTITRFYRFKWTPASGPTALDQLSASGAIVSKPFATAHHLAIGSRFPVDTQSAVKLTLTVRGIQTLPTFGALLGPVTISTALFNHSFFQPSDAAILANTGGATPAAQQSLTQFPWFTYTGNSFANSTTVRPNAATSIKDASAAEAINGKTVFSEPTGPNTPLATDSSGNQLYPGPGDNSFVDRPNNCVAQTNPPQLAGTCLLGGGSHSPGPRTDANAVSLSKDMIQDNSVVATDKGRAVTGNGIPAGAYVGKVTDTPTTATDPSGSRPTTAAVGFRPRDAVHTILAIVIFASLIVAASKLGSTLEHRPAWHSVKRWLTTLPWVMTGAAVGILMALRAQG